MSERAGAREGATVVVVRGSRESGARWADVLSRRYRVRAVDDTERALDLIVSEDADLLVVVVAAPPATRELDLLRAVRRHEGASDVPVVALLPEEVRELAPAILRDGAEDCVHLPVDDEELCERVERRLAAARRRDRMEAEVAAARELLRELEHRVKGDLQTITSLLNLELRATGSEECRAVLAAVMGRVNTMTLLYRTLRETDGPREVDLPRYLEAVVSAAADAARGPGTGRPWETVVEPLSLDVDRAGSCGLIVHELVSEAGRPGAPDRDGGPRRVVLRSEGEAVVVIVEAADGHTDAPSGDGGFGGVELVPALVRQLEGSLRIDEGPGFAARVDFPRRPDGAVSPPAGADAKADSP